MDLSDAELSDLAAFLGRRLDARLADTPPPADAREADARTAVWRDTLTLHRDAGTLSALMTRIARRHPNDDALQQATALLTEPAGSDTLAVFALLGVAGGAAMAAGIALVGLIALVASGLDGSAPRSEPVTLGVIGAMDGEHPGRHERIPGVPREPRPLARAGGRCSGPDGGPVGWYDAGTSHPGPIGTVRIVEGRHNVRALYPARDNGWTTNSRIRCVLQPGDRVRIGAEPVRVDGGRWWVPVHTGDVLSDQTARSAGDWMDGHG